MRPSDGVIIIASKLDAEKKNSYDLTIGVTDGYNELETHVSHIIVLYNLMKDTFADGSDLNRFYLKGTLQNRFC